MNQDLAHLLHQSVYSVTEISLLLKTMVESTFNAIKIRGELSGVKKHVSGHIYFTLKDQESVIDGVCWRGTAGQYQKLMHDGLEVICTGRLSIYPSRSKYQMIVEHIEPAGEGALLKLLEERKKKLALEGLFDQSRKKPLPLLPTTIGIITSLTGAVIRDILHRLYDRFPRPILLWPVLVQGQGAAEQIAAAINGFNELPLAGEITRPDLIIVARGGGSLEDLWAFNEEIVVRAAACSQIPLISAVGHETDWTLIDFASDHRSPTPSAAAEQAVPVRHDLLRKTDDIKTRLKRSALRIYEDKLLKLDDGYDLMTKMLTLMIREKTNQLISARIRSPLDLTNRLQEQLAHKSDRLTPAIKHVVKETQHQLNQLAGLLDSYSYTKTLQRGFCLVKDYHHIIHRGAELQPQQRIELNFYDQSVPAIVTTDLDHSQSGSEEPQQLNLW
jgi:exodeoxyribonuclease VII large subunit